ncbi:MAG: tetratricopeptide repeat protein [Candidatus Binatia bacterium]
MKLPRVQTWISVSLLVVLTTTRLSWGDAATEAYEDGARLLGERQHRTAITAFDKALRLNPRYTEAYNARGIAYHELAQYDRAIKDYDEALALNPQYSEAYFNRGNAYNDMRQYEQAIKDYDEVIRLDQNHVGAYYNRALAHMTLQQGEAAVDARAYLNLRGWQEEEGRSQYMVIFAYFGDRWAKRDNEAKQILEEAASKCNQAVWPYPVIRYLRREVSAEDLLAAATDSDKKTEARTYLGLDLMLAGKQEEGRRHLQWVKDNGRKAFAEYAFALAALQNASANTVAKP